MGGRLSLQLKRGYSCIHIWHSCNIVQCDIYTRLVEKEECRTDVLIEPVDRLFITLVLKVLIMQAMMHEKCTYMWALQQGHSR